MNRSLFHVGLIIAGIIALLGIILLVPRLMPHIGEGTRYQYNFFDFVEKDGTWFTQVQGGTELYQVALRHGPRELENITVRGDIARFGAENGFLYITFDPDKSVHTQYTTMANAEIAVGLVTHFGKTIKPACIRNDSQCDGVDIVTCNSTLLGVVFINDVDTPASVTVSGNCVTVSGRGEALVMAADRFMYGLYGIMK
jgi:hypothetical protein